MRISNTVDPDRNIDLGSWSTVSSISQNFSICVISTVGNPNSAPADYQTRLRNNVAGLENTGFRLTNQNDNNEIIAVSFEFTDLYSLTSEGLTPNNWTGKDKNGAQNNCPNGNNAGLLMTIAYNDLATVNAGDYTGDFLFEAEGGSGNQNASLALTVTLRIDPLVKVSGLSDIIFPPWLGSGNLQQTTSFCVYRNSPGTYQATLYGSGPGAAFSLSNGLDQLPYSVSYSDGISTAAVTSNTALFNRQNVFTTSPDCNLYSANNASIEISLLEADLNAVTQGAYNGIVTLIIAPE